MYPCLGSLAGWAQSLRLKQISQPAGEAQGSSLASPTLAAVDVSILLLEAAPADGLTNLRLWLSKVELRMGATGGREAEWEVAAGMKART